MTNSLTIRDLGSGDLDALLGLYVQLHPHDAALPARAEVERVWQTLLGDPAQVDLGAFVQGQLVAAARATIVPNLTRGARPYALVENVITAAAHRRKGIGARLMRALIDRCRGQRCYKVMLLSAAARGPSHGFYEALGFDRTAKRAFVLTLP